MVSALRKLQVADRLHKTSPVVLCAVCWDREQRKGRSAACLGWCEVGWVGSMERGPRRLLGGGEKLRGKWELVWQTSQEEGRMCGGQKCERPWCVCRAAADFTRVGKVWAWEPGRERRGRAGVRWERQAPGRSRRTSWFADHQVVGGCL